MSMRMKDRGGGGGKIVASKPQKTLGEASSAEKTSAQKPRLHTRGKENAGNLSAGKFAPASGIRWSTSSIPGGKASDPLQHHRLVPGVLAERRSSVGGLQVGRKFDPISKNVVGSAVRGIRTVSDRKMKGESRVSDDASGRKSEKCRNLVGSVNSCARKDGSEQNVKKSTVVESSGSHKINVFPTKNSVKTISKFPESYLMKNRLKDVASFSADPKISAKKTLVNGSKVSRVSRSCKDEARSSLPDFGNVNGSHVLPIKCTEFKLDLLPDSPTPLKEEVKERQDLVVVESKPPDPTVPINISEIGGELRASVDAQEESEKLPTFVVRVINSPRASSANRGETMSNVMAGIKAFEGLKERKLDERKSATPADKLPSKLHEKLALLEGKVLRIASEIKRTKEMLAMSNPDESKVMLTEIQNRISGLEKVVDQVIDKRSVSSNSSQGSCKSSSAITSLDHDELESRFFPHQRLLKNRASSSLCDPTDVVAASNSSKPIDVSSNGFISSIDKNPIALEFLTALEPYQPEHYREDQKFQTVQSKAVAATGGEYTSSSAVQGAVGTAICEHNKEDFSLISREKIEEIDDVDNKDEKAVVEEMEDLESNQLSGIGNKICTAGWFVSEGEAALLAHEDNSCSYYDITNSEEKSMYKPPSGVPNNIWGDCWLIRAPGADGCSGKYVVVASAGTTTDSGFCSWDFYTKSIKAFKMEDDHSSCFSTTSSLSRTALAPISNRAATQSTEISRLAAESCLQWWYRPCSPLLISTASKRKSVRAYDIRDGDMVIKWEVKNPVAGMEYTSPLQWRSRGKLIIADSESISLWDVNSLTPQPLLSVALAGKKVYSLHVNNTDTEIGGGVRQRVSSSEVEGNDGVFCTQDGVNVFDFRLPSGVGLRIPRHGATGHSLFSRGDSILVGSTDTRPSIQSGLQATFQQFSLRKGRLASTYFIPNTSAHFHHSSITQVWGNSALVMGISGLGLFMFDAAKEEVRPCSVSQVREAIGSDDLVRPTFDYLASRVLVISRDRPAAWKYVS